MNYFKLLSLLVITALGNAIAAPQVIHLQKGEQKIVLFGTIHIAKPDFYPLPPTVLTDLEAADALAVEIDMTDEELKNESVALMMANAVTKNTQPLTENQLDQVKHIFGEVDANLGGGEPWFLSIMISLERADKLGFTEKGIDEALIAIAKQQSKKIISLEQPIEQIGIFKKLPQQESLQLFNDAVSDEFENELNLTEQIWRNNDNQSAETLHKKMRLETPVLYQFINTERNETMAERIIKHNGTYPTLFVAIGSMHLYGDGSVVSHLISHGFKKID